MQPAAVFAQSAVLEDSLFCREYAESWLSNAHSPVKLVSTVINTSIHTYVCTHPRQKHNVLCVNLTSSPSKTRFK